MPEILIVDDESCITTLLQVVLNADKFNTTCVNNPDSALELLRKCAFDVMISDVRMAPMNGLSLIKQARMLQPDLQVIIISAFATDQLRHEALQNGVFAVFSKPFKCAEVSQAVEEALARRARKHTGPPGTSAQSGSHAR